MDHIEIIRAPFGLRPLGLKNSDNKIIAHIRSACAKATPDTLAEEPRTLKRERQEICCSRLQCLRKIPPLPRAEKQHTLADIDQQIIALANRVLVKQSCTHTCRSAAPFYKRAIRRLSLSLTALAQNTTLHDSRRAAHIDNGAISKLSLLLAALAQDPTTQYGRSAAHFYE